MSPAGKRKHAVLHPVFSYNFQRIVEVAGKTQREIARALDVSESIVAKWSQGRSEPTGSNLVRLASFLGRNPTEFYLPMPEKHRNPSMGRTS